MPHRRKTITAASIVTVLALGYCLGTRSGSPTAIAEPPTKRLPTPAVNAIDVLFSPKGGCTDRIVRELGGTKRSVRVQAYSFTSSAIAKALVAAHRRGVTVDVILDASQASEQYSSSRFLTNASVPTLIDSDHAIAHNKVMIIDDRIVITGSFNFTKAAEEKNAENLLVIDSPALAAKYVVNFAAHQKHSKVPN